MNSPWPCAVVLVGCAAHVSPAEEAMLARFPPTDQAWTLSDHQASFDTLIEVSQASPPEALPMADGAGKALVARWADLGEVSALAASMDLSELAAFSEHQRRVLGAYSTRFMAGEPYGEEVLALTAVQIRLAVVQIDRFQAELGLTPEVFRSQPVRLEGLHQLRHGLYQIVTGLVSVTAQRPDLMPPERLAARMAPVWSEVTAFLLPEEAEAIRQVLGPLGTDDLLPALQADAPRHELLTAFEAGHRAWSRKQDEAFALALQGLQAATVIGPEGTGTRFAFPGAGFSAVFPVTPGALEQSFEALDGVPSTIRSLSAKAEGGMSLTVMCISRPSPFEGRTGAVWSREMLEGMSVTDTAEVTVSGVAGLRGVAHTALSEGMVLVVPVDNAGCIVTAEYPPQAGAEAAGSFLDSFKLSP